MGNNEKRDEVLGFYVSEIRINEIGNEDISAKTEKFGSCKEACQEAENKISGLKREQKETEDELGTINHEIRQMYPGYKKDDNLILGQR